MEDHPEYIVTQRKDEVNILREEDMLLYGSLIVSRYISMGKHFIW
jgi:hypothetical protein